MKKVFWRILLVLAILLICPFVAQAASDPDKLLFDIGEGRIVIKSQSETSNRVTYGDSAYKDIPKDAEIIITGQTKAHFIKVHPGVTANIRLSGADITSDLGGDSALSVGGGAKVNLTLTDGTNNRLVGGTECHGIYVARKSKDGFGTLVITDSGRGALVAKAGRGSRHAGIYGGQVVINGGAIEAWVAEDNEFIADFDCNDITINGGTLTTGTIGEQVYGYGNGGKITINGGTISADQIFFKYRSPEQELIINGGNIGVRDHAFMPSAKNASGQYLQRTRMTTMFTNDTISNVSPRYGLKDVKSDSNKNIFLYLPENIEPDYSSLQYNGITYTALVKLNEPSVFAPQTNDISIGPLTFAGTKEYPTLNGVRYAGTFTVKQSRSGSTTNTIRVLSGEHDIALDNVHIDVSKMKNTSAFVIENGAKANLRLTAGTTSRLTGGHSSAGLCVAGYPKNSGTLVIEGAANAALVAQGGMYGAGIGGGESRMAGNITINGGSITAKSGLYGAGIGSGNQGWGCDITINAGTVETGSIGCGWNSIGGTHNIAITGGTVTTQTMGLGSDNEGRILISGGMVKAGRIGGSNGGGTDNPLVITGGNVNAGAMFATVKNASGQPIYKATMTTKNANETVGGVSPSYGMADVKSDAEKNLYFYLPENTGSTFSSLTYAGAVYKARVNVKGTEVFSKESALSINTAKQITKYSAPSRAFRVISSPANLRGFRVEYKVHGLPVADYSTDLPIEPGLHDVRVTRPRDTEYAQFEVEIENGLELLDSFFYTVAYHGNGATDGQTPDSKHAYGVKNALNGNDFVKTGFEFEGWDIDPDGASVVYTDGQEVVNLTRTDGAVVNLYAVWKPAKYYVLYEPGRHGLGAAQADVKTGGTILTLQGAIFTREGYVQTGWTASDGGDKAYELSGEYAQEAPITLYPVWTKASFVIVDQSGRTTLCDNLNQALERVKSGDTLRPTQDCAHPGDVTIPGGVTFDLGGFGLICGKLDVSKGSTAIIGEGQAVEVSPIGGESAAGSRFKGLRIMGEVVSGGQITLDGASIQGAGILTVKAGGVTLKGASYTGRIRLAKGIAIALDESYEMGNLSGIVYLPEDCYASDYRVLTGNLETEHNFMLGNAPDDNWFIGAHGCLLRGGMGDGPVIPVLIPDRLVIGVDAPVNVNNLLPYGFKGASAWLSGDENIVKVVKKNGKQQIRGVSEGETTLSLLNDGEVEKAIPVAVVAKDQAVGKVAGPGSVKLRPGETKTLELQITPETALDKTLFYYVNKPGVAIAQDGAVTGIRKGTCRVTVVSTSGARKVVKVTVKKFAPIETAELSATRCTLKKGETVTLSVTIAPDEANHSVTWSSKNPKIASVKGGVVTAKKPGTAKILCKLADGTKLVCEITVTR